MFPLRSAARLLQNGPRMQRRLYVTNRSFSSLKSKRLSWEAPRSLKNSSLVVMRNCVAQVEFVLAFRIRRGVQVLSLYARLWDEVPLLRFLLRLRRLAIRRTKDLLLAAVAFKFDWDTNRIPDEELKSHSAEFDICSALLKECRDEKKPESQNTACVSAIEGDESDDVPEGKEWVKTVGRENISVWKKHEGGGQYTYKIYAKFSDVTAVDFFDLYLDVENRTKWDDHAVILKKIDSEEATNSDVIYWETKWPSLFSNRDYVFNRRWLIDPKQKIMVVKSRSTAHPSVPLFNGKSRVNEYWSYAVIKPFNNFNEPGLEFSLTYFDNHRAVLPNTLTHWVTENGVPDYISRLRLEALKLKEKREEREAVEAEHRRIAQEKFRAEEAKKKEAEKKSEPPRKPPEDQGFQEIDPVVIFIFTLMDKIKETFLDLKIDLERRVAVAQKSIVSPFR